jgi:hypothetical protein
MEFVDIGTVSLFDTFVPCDVDGTEEVNINIEDAIDINNEMPEAISLPPINTENEVMIRGGCEVEAAHDFWPFIAPKVNFEITNILSCFLYILCAKCHLIYVSHS